MTRIVISALLTFATVLRAQSGAAVRYEVDVRLATRVDSSGQQAASRFSGHYLVTVSTLDSAGHNARIVLDSLAGVREGSGYGFFSRERFLGLQGSYLTLRVDSSGISFDGPLLSSSYWAPSMYAVAQQLASLFGNPVPPAVGVARADTVQRFLTPSGGPRESTTSITGVFTERADGDAVVVRNTDSTTTIGQDQTVQLRMLAVDTTRYTLVPGQWLRRAVDRTIKVSAVRKTLADQDSVMTFTTDQLTAKRLTP